jgi:hypothetical protein
VGSRLTRLHVTMKFGSSFNDCVHADRTAKLIVSRYDQDPNRTDTLKVVELLGYTSYDR